MWEKRSERRKALEEEVWSLESREKKANGSMCKGIGKQCTRKCGK